jgi:hypothetical protein
LDCLVGRDRADKCTETKGKTLEEMDRVFGSHTGEEDQMLLEEAQRDVGLTAYLDGQTDSHNQGFSKGAGTGISMVELA